MGSWWFHVFFEMIPLDGSCNWGSEAPVWSRREWHIDIGYWGYIDEYFFLRECDQIGTPNFHVK